MALMVGPEELGAKTAMELISYEEFAKFRLRDFAPDPAAVDESDAWEWMDSFWINESIGFTSFSRHESTPEQTGGLEISFSELPAEANQRILSAVGLPLRPGMSREQVVSALGELGNMHQFVADRCTYEFNVGSAQPYLVDCTIHNMDGLIHVTVIRADIISRGD